jgi:hypothetical protein
MRMQQRLANLAFALSLALAAHAACAGVPTMNECFEASDFIANAARSRDNGVDRETFVGRLHEDFASIRAFPPTLRWFVKDDDDEKFLAGAAATVYDRPLSPERHREVFLRACLDRLAGAEATEASRNRATPGTI